MRGDIYLLLPVLLPALAGVALRLIRLEGKPRARAFVFAGVLSACASLAALLLPSARLTVWAITDAINITFALDGVSRFYVAFISVVWALVIVYAYGYMDNDEQPARFFMYYLTTYGALMGLAMSENLITFYMFYELMTLLTVPLVAHNRDKQAIAAAIKYLLYSVFGASCALLGIFFVGAYAGTFSFAPGGILDAARVAGREGLLRAIFFVMIAGFGVKAGMFPMHSWLPAAHPVAPAPASAVLSGVITKMGVLGIIRVIFYVAGADMLRGTWAQYAFMTLSLVGVVMGSMMAFIEKQFKKRLAYSTVSQVSYVLFGLSTLTEIGFVGALLHILFHSLIKNTLFMSAGAVIHKTGLTDVDDLRGTGKTMPVTLACFTLASLGLIGIPPTGGFISKWYLAQGALSTGLDAAWTGPCALLISAILTAAYLLTISIRACFPGADFKPRPRDDVKACMLAPMCALTVSALVLGALPSGLIDFFTRLAQSLM